MTRSRELAELASAYDSGGSMGFRNRIINGDMRIDQRNNGASVTITAASTTQYVLDRWYLRAESATGSKVSVQRSTVAPTGFTNSQLITSLSSYTIGAAEHFATVQAVEGFNSADLAWGTASAQTVTVSFWVRSSLTGTFGGFALNNDANRCFLFSYTINAANTWEQKTITIPGDTTGTWRTDNGVGMYLNFSLATGSSLVGTPGSWSSTFNRSVTGQVSLVGTNGATFYITGVQLEAGTVATPFERRDYGRELMMCQRYFQKLAPDMGWYRIFNMGLYVDGTYLRFLATYFQPMRSMPTITYTGTANSSYGVMSGGSIQTGFVFGVEAITNTSIVLQADKTEHGLNTSSPNTVFFVDIGNVGPYLSAEL